MTYLNSKLITPDEVARLGATLDRAQRMIVPYERDHGNLSVVAEILGDVIRVLQAVVIGQPVRVRW